MGDNDAMKSSDGVRLHIGGLGPTVTAADIEETFSTLGRVSGVEVIRTKGRSMAYMNFHPLPGKTLLQLFSKYNGCSWKHGKLKLEKAKEHYLDRLKREWAEEAKATSEKPVVENVEKKIPLTSKLERLKMEDVQLHMYFPKLRKVKSLPYKGTGKHKYSFQRIEVPPLPIHFCSCDEHLEPSFRTSQKLLTCVNTGVYYEKELDIMSSVMNKLFEKENIQPSAGNETMPKVTEDVLDRSISENPNEESEEEEEEEAEEEEEDDDLVMNFGSRKNSDDLLKKLGSAMQDTQKPALSKDQPPKKQPDQLKNNAEAQKKVTFATPSQVKDEKKMHSEIPAKPIEDEFTAILPPYEVPEVHTIQQEASIQPQAQTAPAQTETIKGQSWLQKSSWKNLIGGTENVSTFSISNLVPNISSLTQSKAEPKDIDIHSSSEPKKDKVQSDDQKKTEVPLEKATIEKAPIEKSLFEKAPSEKAPINNVTSIFVRKEPTKKDPGTSDVCTFMRNSLSVKQWSKARAALGGKPSKRRNVDNDEDDSPKGKKNAQPFKRQRF